MNHNRKTKFQNCELRAETLEGKKILKGYPILFNTIGTPYSFSDWREIILPESVKGVDFTKTRILVNHDENNIIGMCGVNATTAIDEIGVYLKVEEIDTQMFRDTWELVNLGILDGMSFAFRANLIESNFDVMIDYIKQFSEVPEFSILPSGRTAYKDATIIADSELTLNSKINKKLNK
jgi:hypothetical protein